MEELTTEVQVATSTDAFEPDGSSNASFENMYNLMLFWSIIGIALLARKMFRTMFRNLSYGRDKSKK